MFKRPLSKKTKIIDHCKVTANLFKQERTERTRGHSQMLTKKHCNLDIRKHSFAYRTINIWNNLPEEVIKSSTITEFEIKLDHHWQDHELKLDFKHV